MFENLQKTDFSVRRVHGKHNIERSIERKDVDLDLRLTASPAATGCVLLQTLQTTLSRASPSLALLKRALFAGCLTLLSAVRASSAVC